MAIIFGGPGDGPNKKFKAKPTNPYNLQKQSSDALQYYQNISDKLKQYSRGYDASSKTSQKPTYDPVTDRIIPGKATVIMPDQNTFGSALGSKDFAHVVNGKPDFTNTCVGSSCYIANDAGSTDVGATENAAWARRVRDDGSWVVIPNDQVQPGDRITYWAKPTEANKAGKWKLDQLRGLDKELGAEGFTPYHMVTAGEKDDKGNLYTYSDGSDGKSYKKNVFTRDPDVRYFAYRYVGSNESEKRFLENQKIQEQNKNNPTGQQKPLPYTAKTLNPNIRTSSGFSTADLMQQYKEQNPKPAPKMRLGGPMPAKDCGCGGHKKLENGGTVGGCGCNKKTPMYAKGGIMDAQGNAIDTNQISSHINDLQSSGKLSRREAIRLQKGLMKINDASGQGVEYKVTGDGVFTAKKDGKDIEGQASGLNQNGNFVQRNLEGRKVSKVMQLASGLNASQAGQPAAAANATAAAAATETTPMGTTPVAANKEQPSLLQTAYNNPSLDLVANPLSMGKPGYTNPVNNLNTFTANVKNVDTPAVASAGKPAQNTAQKTSTQNRAQAKPAQKQAIKLGSSNGAASKAPAQKQPANTQKNVPVLDLYTQQDAAKEKASQPVATQPAQKIQPVAQSLKNTVAANTAVGKGVQKPAPAQNVQQQPSGPGLRSMMNSAVINQSKKYTPSNPDQQIQIRQKQDQQFAQNNADQFERARQEFAKNPNLQQYKASYIPNPLYLFSPIEYSIDRSGKYQRIEKKDIGGLALSGMQAPNTALKVNAFSMGKPGYTNPINNQATFIEKAKAIGGFASPVAGTQKMISPNYQNPMAKQSTDGAGSGLNQGTGLRLLNAGLGVAGAINYATAKQPTLPGPGKFESVINPATGMSEASKRFAQTQIAANTAAASQPATSDARLNQQAKLQANYNANQALRNLAVQDAEMMKQDQMRVNQQVNQDALMNFQNQQAYNQQKFGLENDAFNQRRQMGAGMVQSAVNYENQRAADMANKRIAENTANNQINMMAEQAILQENANRRIAYKPQMTPEEEAAFRQRFSSYNTNNYQRPMRFRLGGPLGKTY